MTANKSIPPIKTTQSLIALYCGSRTGNKPIYRDTAIELAQHIANQVLVLYMAVRASV